MQLAWDGREGAGNGTTQKTVQQLNSCAKSKEEQLKNEFIPYPCRALIIIDINSFLCLVLNYSVLLAAPEKHYSSATRDQSTSHYFLLLVEDPGRGVKKQVSVEILSPEDLNYPFHLVRSPPVIFNF